MSEKLRVKIRIQDPWYRYFRVCNILFYDFPKFSHNVNRKAYRQAKHNRYPCLRPWGRRKVLLRRDSSRQNTLALFGSFQYRRNEVFDPVRPAVSEMPELEPGVQRCRAYWTRLSVGPEFSPPARTESLPDFQWTGIIRGNCATRCQYGWSDSASLSAWIWGKRHGISTKINKIIQLIIRNSNILNVEKIKIQKYPNKII